MIRATCLVTVLALGVIAPFAAAQAPELHISGAPEFSAAVEEYRRIWETDGAKVISVLESVSGLKFRTHRVNVEVIDGPSWAGSSSMGLRATYSADTKRATLVHELGHILVGDLVPDGVAPGTAPTPHYLLFLFLYDSWVRLWGEDFADAQVVVEGRRG